MEPSNQPPSDAPRPAAPRRPIRSWRLILTAAVALVGAALAGLLLLQHHGDVIASAAVDQVCGDTAAGPSGCETVARSAYSEYRGVPLAAIGLLFYLCLAVLLLLGVLLRDEALEAAAFLGLLGLALALLVDVMLLGVQAFVIRAFCQLCLLSYALNLLGLTLLLPAAHAIRAVFRALGSRVGRGALFAWLVSSIALGLAVGAANELLIQRGEQRAASILGEPPPAASPLPSAAPEAAAVEPPEATPPPASPEAAAEADLAAQLEASRAEVRRLQALLDDPKKLEQHFTEKSLQEFAQAAVQDLPLAGTPFKGPETAPIQVVEFSDFLCPFCRNIAGAFANYLPRSGNRVAIYFKNYPLDQGCHPSLPNTVHPGACLLALGAICAQDQARFWPYHDKVFASQLNNPQLADVTRLAGSVGLDTSAFEACLTSARAKERLTAEIQQGVRAGVQATPTLFLNGKRLPRVNDFLAAVEQETKRLGLPPLPEGQNQ